MQGDALAQLISDSEVLSGPVRGHYCADGSGVLLAWGAAFERKWSIGGDGNLCIESDRGVFCYLIERHPTESDRYRGVDLESGRSDEFSFSGRTPRRCTPE